MNKAKVISHINPLVFQGVAHRGLWNKEISEIDDYFFSNKYKLKKEEVDYINESIDYLDME